jgi:hypothetical protein
VPPAYWSCNASDLLAELGTSPQGLPAAEAAQRLRRDGPNAVHGQPRLDAVKPVVLANNRWRCELVRPQHFLLAPGAAVVRFGAEHDYHRRTNAPLQLSLPVTTGRKVVDIVESPQPA